MGLFLTITYIVAAYVSPRTLYGDLAIYRPGVVVAIAAIIFSLFAAQGSRLLQLNQTWSIFGLCIAVFWSVALNGWFGGGWFSMLDFLAAASVYILIVLNCKTRRHLCYVIAALFGVALFIIVQGSYALSTRDLGSPYVLIQVDAGAFFYRLRGISFLNDPNDLAQFLVCLLPCMFVFWRKSNVFRNLFFVYLPSAALLWGIFLTRSRGGLVALTAVAVVAGRRKLGVVTSSVLAVLIFAGLYAAGATGGRDVSVASGSDRIEAWSVGLTLLRSHPIFGVGYGRFVELNDITAHNTIIVCAAELGIVGLFFWMMFVFTTAWDTGYAGVNPKFRKAVADKNRDDFYSLPEASASETEEAAGAEQAAEDRAAFTVTQREEIQRPIQISEYLEAVKNEDQMTEDELHRLCSVMVCALAGFMVSSWFLSRSYSMHLFVQCGLATVTYRMARERNLGRPPLKFWQAVKYTAIICPGILVFLYLFVRFGR